MSPDEILSFAKSLEKEGDYYRAITEYKRYLYYNDVDSIRLKIALIYTKEGDLGNAIQIMKGIKNKDKGFKELMGWIFYKAEYFDSVKNYWEDEKLGLIYLREGRCREGLKILNIDRECPNYKNPFLGSFFSLVLPGAGRIYAGRPGDGIFSFLTIASFAYSTYYYYERGKYIYAGVLGTLTCIFYAGEIFGSYISVKIYNNRLQLDFIKSIEENFR
jgi:TM2 domain-containing membrane protein YozV